METLSFKCVDDFSDLDKKEITQEIENIFFLSSSVKNFDSKAKKDLFFKKWCGDYLTLFPESFFVAIDLETQRVYGYICGVKDTTASLSHLSVPGLSVFEDLYLKYPAHLHINFHPDSRGMGLGSKLVLEFMNYLRVQNVVGLHLITSKESENIRFYERLGFTDCHERSMNGYGLYFMGQEL